ncbi:MAG: MBL fold metallo-hydrolase [Parvibaculaceae bacterium]
MKALSLGDITVTRIVEREGPHVPVEHLLPDADPDQLAPHRAWLEPHFLTPDNRIVHSFHSFVIRTPKLTAVVDTCIGNDKHRPDYPNFHMRKGPFLDDLALAGVRPEEVDYVMCTHLHVDHVGWNTRLAGGKWVPTFPNAKYLFGKAEFDFWRRELDTGGPQLSDDSIADSVIPIVEAGAAVMVESDHQIDDRIWLTPAPGHTPGQYCVNLKDRRHAVMTADIMHSPIQCAKPHWNSAYCIEQERARATRRAFLEEFSDRDVLLLPAHFATPTCGRVVAEGEAWRYEVLAA